MPLDRRVPTLQAKITVRWANRDVPIRTILVVVAVVVPLLLVAAWLRPSREVFAGLLALGLLLGGLGLKWRPNGLLPEEWIRRKVMGLWVPKTMVWAPRAEEAIREEVTGVAVRPLFDEEEEEQ